MEKLKKIRKEYGSLRAAIEHYAGMGCSRSMTAEALCVDRRTLRRMIARFGVDSLFVERSQMLPECRGVGHPAKAETNRRRIGQRRVTDEELLADVAKYVKTRDFRKGSVFALGTVYSRFGSYADARALAVAQVVARQRGGSSVEPCHDFATFT